MKKKLMLLLLCAGVLLAQADAKDTKKGAPAPAGVGPTAEEIISVSTHVRNFYRINGQLTQLQQMSEQERAAAQAAAKVVEQKYNCTYDLDTDMCVLKQPAKAEQEKK